MGTVYNQIGKVICLERIKAGVSVDQLCQGICSRSYLARIESGERGCEKIMSEALLQRLDVPQERFLYFLNNREYERLCAREKLYEAVDSGLEEEYRIAREEYIRITQGQSRLHEQFLLLSECVWEWERSRNAGKEGSGVGQQTLDKLRRAWNITQSSELSERPVPERMSYMELSVKSLYLRIQEELGKTDEAMEGYRKLFERLRRKTTGLGRVSFCVQIGYRILLLLEKSDNCSVESAEVYKACTDMLRQTGGLFLLADLMEYRLRQLKKARDEGMDHDGVKQETKRAEGLCASLRWLYEEYSVKPADWIWYPTDDVEETYVLSQMIRGRRQAMGMTQEMLGDGICDPVTVSRIESGLVVPKQGVMTKLLEKLNIPGGSIVLSAQTGKTELHRLTEEFNLLTKMGKIQEALPLMEQILKNAGRNRYVDQYLTVIEAQTLYGAGKLDAPSVQERLWKALFMTVPDKKPEDLNTWIFTRTETSIINCISQSCEKVGQRDKGISWLKLLLQYYDKIPSVRRKGMENYEMALRNLGNLLGNNKEYEEAIRTEDIAIRIGLQTGRVNRIILTAYDRTWNMEQLKKQGKNNKKLRRSYMKAALELAYMYSTANRICFLEKHWKKYYEKD